MRYIKKHKKKDDQTSNVTIIIDDREKRPWTLDYPGFTTERARLKVGDYSIKGYEDRVAIEKKSGLKELLIDLSRKNRPRFKRFLVKLAAYEIKCLVIEKDSLDDMNQILAAMPLTHLTPETVTYWIAKIIIDYGIPVLLIGGKRQRKDLMLYHLFKAAVEKIKKGT